MKAVNFNHYSNSKIREVSIKLRYLNPENDKTLPVEIFNFLNKENAQVGNVSTRISRCISLLNQQIISRFMNEKVNLETDFVVKGIISILNFFNVSDDEVKEMKSFNTDSNLQMILILGEMGLNLISFTEMLSNEKLWNNSPKEFFSDNKKVLKFFSEKLNYYLSL
jgi:hypothetical protein